MKKSPIITLFIMLLAVVFVFCSCEASINLKKDDDTVVKPGDVIVNEEGETVQVVDIVEVTNESGKVVSTEVVTISANEMKDSDSFFKSQSNSAESNNGNKNNNSSDKNSSAGSSLINSTDPAPDRITEPASDSTNTENDLDILKSDKYLVIGRVVTADGTIYPYKTARYGTKYSAMTTFEGNELGLIVNDNNVYLVSPAEESYIKISKSFIEENGGDTEEMKELFNGEGLDYNKTEVKRRKKTIDGIKYTIIEYEDGTLDYMNGNVLVKSEASDGSVLYYDTITSNVSSGYFVPPSNYKEQELTIDNVNNIVGSDVITTEQTTVHTHED
ncbi:MAG: hypothetical protein ACI4IF_06570 [Acutalibacteraceae bacterium]